ncbi:MAG: L,D-transpeptidase family protein [Mobilitalea sp.]
MRRIIKSLIKLHYAVLVLCLAAVLFLADTQEVSAQEKLKIPYLIKVNREYNTITVYETDEAGKYTIPIKAMICSVGKTGKTIRGTFQTKAKYRWKALLGNVWGQYSTRIVGGILFHSVYYYRNGDPASLATTEYNKLGTAASHGCIRLTVKDAKWIYDNCAVGTTVVIYDDRKSPGPLGKPETIKISTAIRWDPTDPSDQNPYKDKLPKITGAKNITVAWGDEIDLLKGVIAKSSLGTNITTLLSVEGTINTFIPGEYEVIYSVTDVLDRIGIKKITVTVEECKLIPELKGIIDKVVGEGIVIDIEYALSEVEAYCTDVEIDKTDIEVTIEEIREDEYYISYYLSFGQSPTVTEYATIFVDREAPTFIGIADRLIEFGVVPDETYALTDITISDNYSEMNNSDIAITIEVNLDGSYLITYKAVDEVGNEAIEQALFHN